MIREFGWYDIYFILQGAGWTLSLSVIAFLGGSIIGLPMAIVRVSRHAWVRALAVIYIQAIQGVPVLLLLFIFRSEEHTSELQSLMRISYAVFCLKKKNKIIINKTVNNENLKPTWNTYNTHKENNK